MRPILALNYLLQIEQERFTSHSNTGPGYQARLLAAGRFFFFFFFFF